MIDSPLNEMVSYINKIMQDDDPDTTECKYGYNAALITNSKLQKLHEDDKQDSIINTEDSFNNATINVNSKYIFNETWDLTKDQKMEELLDSMSTNPNDYDNQPT